MKTEVKKKVALNAVPEAALEEAGLAKETILAAIPMDGAVLVTKDSMPIVELAADAGQTESVRGGNADGGRCGMRAV